MFMSDSFNQNKGFYTHDGIHFNSRGTSRYNKIINNIVGILNYHSFACANCGELNHKTFSCRFEMKIKCHKCNMYGHKQKFCLALKKEENANVTTVSNRFNTLLTLCSECNLLSCICKSTFSISQEYGISKRNKKGSVNYVIIEEKVNGNYSFDTTKKVSIAKLNSINDALITSDNADTLSQTCGQETLLNDKQLDTNCFMSDNDSNVIIAFDLLYPFPEANFLIDVKLFYIYVFTLAI
ncbi:unnamed protein product [Mytilus coruscus]|uniref:CCHC-type domain-containing protein n=1 Tax=Mytilus coruscus TaxID=42192 RepID=A0A6J8CCA5_MYTCO|nr:unnamed protein product [Mytilus coruscus]